MYVLK